MKKLLLVIMLASISLGASIGCKKKDSMLAIAGSDDKVSLATSFISYGECKILHSFTVTGYSGYYAKVLGNDGQYYWVLKNSIR